MEKKKNVTQIIILQINFVEIFSYLNNNTHKIYFVYKNLYFQFEVVHADSNVKLTRCVINISVLYRHVYVSPYWKKFSYVFTIVTSYTYNKENILTEWEYLFAKMNFISTLCNFFVSVLIFEVPYTIQVHFHIAIKIVILSAFHFARLIQTSISFISKW